MNFNQVMQEAKDEEELMKSYTLSLEKGDEILMGKYRNKKAEIKGFSLDKHNQPVMHTTKGNRKMTAFRIADKMPEESAQQKYSKFLKKKLKEFDKASFKKLSSDQKRRLSDEWAEEKEKEE
jgi:hypothetical protein